ncbi:MAG: thioredoxin-dependent thiol peroxidase [Ignavibacteriaceae bacterium]|jgi:peroxiredoxin Q/BCP|nr:thioredoxin-dependent thiol peroxidase [Ignavibacteriaceae bacterium]MCW8814207.1 thioredoxin-dependent thiol peroxidase [Chlorobium sp.]MCW8817065.1 thioredoxin-dependent thiol peroxidase [Ignavibacteriaceae bacterium]MCW8962139.1 thioredoxin-dependent thiol peroxidase [Ignavibacteriaceae bacterium]MCW9094648.1 thioredoxin-dependent thiol peroxidase [Ignavibacteriaceae bacterium]
MALKVGDKAPSFKLKNQDGETISLSDLKGKPVVLYFYPKDDTSGCTKEACNFRDEFPKFGKMKAEIIGISADSVESHKKFAQKYKLPFNLLSDEKKEVIKKYGVWQEKSMYGKKYMGIVRTTFIIDSSGKIRKIFPKVKVDNHNKEVMEALKEM